MIDIVIVSYNYKKYIIPLLDSLVECQKYSNIEQKIIVVDNSSTDGSENLLREWFMNKNPREYSLNILDKNRGYARAVNYGARQGSGAYIMILNADMLVLDYNWKEMFLEMFPMDSKIAVMGCKLIDQFGKIVGAGTEGTFQRRKFRAYGVKDSDDPEKIFNKMAECINVCGACYMIKREIFQKLKGFDEEFFMYYEEEYFSIKAQVLLGMKVVYIPHTKFLHYTDPSKAGNQSDHQRKSGLIFVRKCREELGIEGVQS